MTLFKLLTIIGVSALVLTLLTGFVFKRVNSWAVSFLQHFGGVFFLVSGAVKAIDPMGTAFKMEQYFSEFERTFSGINANAIASIFPWLSSMSVAFSVFMIVLEIVVGLALVLGYARKTMSWIFLITIIFFAILTGFTHLTGYVPTDKNFFDFAAWGDYNDTNRKVTDCGCFGDFLKLEPKISFFKDLGLLLLGIIFLFTTRKMHQLFGAGARRGITWAGTLACIGFCLFNFMWTEPVIDFRPFKTGVNIRDQKQAEADAMAAVKTTGYNLTNKQNGEKLYVSMEDYMSDYQKYPKDTYEFEPITSKPTMERSKLSDFELEDAQGNHVEEEILADKNKRLLVIAYKLYASEKTEVVMRKDTVYRTDTTRSASGESVLEQTVMEVKEAPVEVVKYTWDESYLDKWRRILPTLEAARAKGMEVDIATAFASEEKLQSFIEALGVNINIYKADDIMLKTILRSNPGPVLLQDGKVLNKWHYRHFPGSVDQLK